MRRGLWFLLGAIFTGLLAGCVTPVAPAPAMSEETAAAETPGAAEELEAAAEETLSGELIVFAAASLTDAFSEIAQNFVTAYPDSNISYNFAGSQQLAQQLAQGAPADVFASANAGQMGVAIEAGRVVSGMQHTFVRNRLVVIYPADNPGGVNTLQDLANPGLKIVLAAPEVPVGGYSLQFLGKASSSPDFTATYSETVVANVVSYEENVRSVLTKVQLGEADAGIVYSSDITPDAAEDMGKIDIPDELNVFASYPIAPVADAENPELAQAFIAYVSGEEGQMVLAKYGFIPTIGVATGDTPTTLLNEKRAAMEQSDVAFTHLAGILAQPLSRYRSISSNEKRAQ